GYRLGFTAEGKLHSIYEKEIHFKIRLLQPPCSTCLSSLPHRHLRRAAWHGRLLQRVRPSKRREKQSLLNTRRPGHTDARRGAVSRSGSAETLARTAIHSAQPRDGGETAHTLSTPYDRN